MNTTEEIIRLLQELNKELADDNDAYDSRQEAQTKTNKEKEND